VRVRALTAIPIGMPPVVTLACGSAQPDFSCALQRLASNTLTVPSAGLVT
jgi:hypothetical protein